MNNSLISKFPELAKEWDYEKNSITPNEVSIGSRKRVFWKGKCGHSWDAIVKDRVRGYGCPICAGKRVVEGINDLLSRYPQIASEWDYESNGVIRPENVSFGSGKKYYWICPNGHKYYASVTGRVRGRGCPVCNRKIVDNGKTDLESQYPFLASEWLYEKNKNKPSEVFANSHSKVWWKCSICKNEWEATIDSRTSGNGCPACSKRLQSSFPEQAVFYYVKQNYPDAINGYTEMFENSMELDVFVPSINTAIEYDGGHWHSNKLSAKREREKYRTCKARGITLIRIREDKSNTVSVNCDFLINLNGSLDDAIKQLSKYIAVPDDINSSRDRFSILENYVTSLKENSLSSKYPDLALEWDYSKNGNLSPDMFTPKNDRKFWWKCANGHEYQSTPAHRTSGSGCPYCSSRKLLKEYNDFATTNSDGILFEQWDYERNDNLGITPDSIMKGSNKKIWWICDKGHEWMASPQSRSHGEGCPVCSGRIVQNGFNDLATQNPALAEEWHPTKNGTLTPTQVSCGSNKMVWWMCSKGHEWKAMIISRNKGYGCPVCSGRIVQNGFNDLATQNPALAEEWHPTKNKDLNPGNILFSSKQKVWWLCKYGHEWISSVYDRSIKKSNCPYCAGKKAIVGENDLFTIHPELKAEWDYEKNVEVDPKSLLSFSNRIVWWKCTKCNYEWQASCAVRNTTIVCPRCSNRIVWKGHNDLLTLYPDVAKEWHNTKNTIAPDDISIGSNQKVWWKCSKCGYEWQASVYNRTGNKSKCPACAGRVVWKGHNDLLTRYPDVAEEWHPTKNKLMPIDINPGTKQKAWWKCKECGYEWETSVQNRTRNNTKCPICSRKR